MTATTLDLPVDTPAIPLHPTQWYVLSEAGSADVTYAQGTPAEAIAYCDAHPNVTALVLPETTVALLRLGEPDALYALATFRFADWHAGKADPPTYRDRMITRIRESGTQVPYPSRTRLRSRLEEHLGIDFILGLDIETVAQQDAMREDPPASEIAAPSNYKDPDKIAEFESKAIERWRRARAKECALDPRLGRVAAIGFAVHGEKPHAWVVTQESDEAAVLRMLWDYLQLPQLLVTFAGVNFDIPFLVKRSLILGVDVPGFVRTWCKRYSLTPHFDVREALTNWAPMQKGTLDDWCKSFGLPLKRGGLTGNDVAGMVERGEWEALGDYAWGDANSALELADRIGTFYLPGYHDRT